jgi:hypothetical protein
MNDPSAQNRFAAKAFGTPSLVGHTTISAGKTEYRPKIP